MFNESLLGFFEREVITEAVGGLRPYMKILSDLAAKRDAMSRSRAHRILKIYSSLIQEGLSELNSSRQSEQPAEPRILFEIAVQWLMKALGRSPIMVSIVRSQRTLTYLSNLPSKPYRSNQAYRRPFCYNYDLYQPTSESDQAFLIRNINKFFRDLFAGNPV